MTPSATTPHGTRGKSASRNGNGSARGTRKAPSADVAHRRSVRQQPAPRVPRRVSGPQTGRVRTPPARSRGAAAQRTGSFRARALAFVQSLPDHALLDRVVRGRAWIPLLGVMLAGIVAMQVEVLKLGASIGRSIQRGTALQSRNELLRAGVASLADDQRIERLAAGMGMTMPAPAAVGFLSPRPSDAQQAAAKIHAPDTSTFLASLAALNAAAQPAQSASQSAPSSQTATAIQTTPAAAPSAAAPVAPSATPVAAAPAAPATQTSSPTSTSSSSGGTMPTGG
jgi:hypothetical protein